MLQQLLVQPQSACHVAAPAGPVRDVVPGGQGAPVVRAQDPRLTGEHRAVQLDRRAEVTGLAALSSTGVFHLGQVAAYLDDESVREGAIESVLSRVTADTRAVMAHSLGTVVAYEALHRLGRPLPLLVTFGSPLGLRSIIRARLRPQPLRTPDGLGRWVNVADRDDYIVSTLRLRKLFPKTDEVLERTHLVKNANADPHAAPEYLKHWETVAPLARVL
ncbi:hypothetical protein [Streptomyces sp. NPDC048295]|uniref:hypothetical protein n=1 Tax=Streptomyces sp. NPDC048295 TaxID=3154617 RepID=UPI0034404437